jgi:fermentation-respiration switch protein FrsA (DUF1100 family)
MKQVLIFSSLMVISVLVFFFVFQRQLIYFPERQTPQLRDYHATDMTLVTLKTKDQVQLTSWYKPAQGHQPTVLFFHGNAGHIGHRMPLIRQFLHAGLGVFLLEYRGYGGNLGAPTEEGLYEDGRAAFQFLQQQGITAQNMVVYGESLGTGVATQLAVEHPLCAVILQSPFTSLASLARHHYPWIPIPPWDRFNSLERIKHIQAPLLIIHGKQDQIVPYDEGLMLFNQANDPKRMLTFEDKNHHDLWDAHGMIDEALHFIQLYCDPR